MKVFYLYLCLHCNHSSYGVKARHGDVPPPRRLGARLARLGACLARLGAHSARRWGSAWTPRRRHENYDCNFASECYKGLYILIIPLLHVIIGLAMFWRSIVVYGWHDGPCSHGKVCVRMVVRYTLVCRIG
jgi:hypothetical protein